MFHTWQRGNEVVLYISVAQTMLLKSELSNSFSSRELVNLPTLRRAPYDPGGLTRSVFSFGCSKVDSDRYMGIRAVFWPWPPWPPWPPLEEKFYKKKVARECPPVNTQPDQLENIFGSLTRGVAMVATVAIDDRTRSCRLRPHSYGFT